MLFAAESQWVGLAYMTIFVAMNVASYSIGFKQGSKSTSPSFIKAIAMAAQQNLIDRKENYKRLCVRYINRINSAIALIHNLSIKTPTPELEKIEKVLRGFDKLAAHAHELGQLTPEQEIDISRLIVTHKEAGGKDARAIGE
jgi:hypothetical protein